MLNVGNTDDHCKIFVSKEYWDREGWGEYIQSTGILVLNVGNTDDHCKIFDVYRV